MKCEQYEELFTGWINKNLTISDRETLEQHVEGCAGCRHELEAMQQLWTEMDALQAPEPSAHLRLKFQTMLDVYKAETERGSFWGNIKDQLSHLWYRQLQWPVAYPLGLVLLSFALGYWISGTRVSPEEQKLQTLSTQVQELKQTMMLTMLENPSASERMKAVSYTSEIKHADGEVINALLTTLNNDPNVNVRLSTLDALTHMATYPEVREGLIRSIAQQDSPLLQSAIADVMLKLQEKRSVGSFKELLKQKDLNPDVKDKITQTITELI